MKETSIDLGFSRFDPCTGQQASAEIIWRRVDLEDFLQQVLSWKRIQKDTVLLAPVRRLPSSMVAGTIPEGQQSLLGAFLSQEFAHLVGDEDNSSYLRLTFPQVFLTSPPGWTIVNFCPQKNGVREMFFLHHFLGKGLHFDLYSGFIPDSLYDHERQMLFSVNAVPWPDQILGIENLAGWQKALGRINYLLLPAEYNPLSGLLKSSQPYKTLVSQVVSVLKRQQADLQAYGEQLAKEWWDQWNAGFIAEE